MSEKQLPREKKTRTKKTRKFSLKNNKKLRWGILIAVAVIVVLIVCSILFPRIFNFDRVRRYFNYLGIPDDGSYGNIRFDSNTTNSFALFDGRFAVGCEDGLYLYNDDGEQAALVQGALPYPKICVGGSIALCYSNESSTLVAMNKKGESILSTTVSGTVLDAEVSTNGCVCYATSDSGCKTLITVMNSDLKEIYRWRSFSQYINCCAISSNASRLAVIGLNQSDSVFCSTLNILRTDSEDDAVIATVELGNQIIYELWFLQDDRICAIGESSTMFFDASGELLNEFTYDGQMLTDFTMHNGDLFLALDGFGSGKDGVVISFASDGSEIARMEFDDPVQSISANGRYLAILTKTELLVCDRKLEIYDREQDVPAANRALARTDGTVLLVSNGQTTLYIP